jgi:hypothetical protein
MAPNKNVDNIPSGCMRAYTTSIVGVNAIFLQRRRSRVFERLVWESRLTIGTAGATCLIFQENKYPASPDFRASFFLSQDNSAMGRRKHLRPD